MRGEYQRLSYSSLRFKLNLKFYNKFLILDWLIHLNEILVGVFAFSITHWGNKIHRASWFGGMVMLQAIACITLVVPELYEPHVDDMRNKTGKLNYLI